MLKTLWTDSKLCWMQWSNRKKSTNERRTTISLFMWFWLTISIITSSQLLRNLSTISTRRSRYTERSRLIWESNSSASLMSTTSARLNGRIIIGNWGNFWRFFGGIIWKLIFIFCNKCKCNCLLWTGFSETQCRIGKPTTEWDFHSRKMNE